MLAPSGAVHQGRTFLRRLRPRSWSSLEMIIDRPLATLNSSTKIREASAGPTAWRQLARKVHNVRADSSARVLGVSRSTRGGLDLPALGRVAAECSRLNLSRG